jgi:hypothetical protein
MTFKWAHFLVVAEALYQDASSASANEAIRTLNNKTTERRFAVEGYCPELSNL